jgi:CRISPR-associated endonuclease Cas2
MKKRNYKGVWVNSFGIPTSKPNFNEKDKIFNKTKRIYNISFSSNFNDNSPKNLMVIYDVPEEQKKERDWFRRHLKKFGYIMIQRSIWVGPSPLPKDFIDYVKSIGLKDKLKTFKLAKEYSNNNNIFK